MAYKVTISGGIVLEKSVQFISFNVDTSDNNDRRTTPKNSMIITGIIDTDEGTAALYQWALLPATNSDCYKEIVVEYYHSDQLVRKVCFSKAFVVDYSEDYPNHASVGTFTLYVRQFFGKEIECIGQTVSQESKIESELAEVSEEALPTIQKKVEPEEIESKRDSGKTKVSFTERLEASKKVIPEPAKTVCLPKNNGKWSGKEGNSEWVPDPEFIPKNPKSNPEQLSWRQISEKYVVSRIAFIDEQPDFSPISKGTVEIEDFSSERDDNFDSADEKLAKERGCSKADVKRWRKKNKYTWHERKDCKTMDKVPTNVHGNVPHSGGISESKKGDI